MNPTVSILIPTYNRSDFLKEALKSILSQEFTDYEILVVDNCSSDDTELVVSNFNDKRIKYHRNNSNIGPIHNHNRALRLATGKYIHLFSDDDIMMPNNLAIKVKVLNDYDRVGLVHSNINSINKIGEVTSNKHWNANTNVGKLLLSDQLMDSVESYKYLYDEWNFISMPSVMIRKSVLDDYKLEFNNQLDYLIDWDLWIKLAMRADFFYLNEPLILYRSHGGNESTFLNKFIYSKELFIIKISLLKEKSINFKFVDALKEIQLSINRQLVLHDEFFVNTKYEKENIIFMVSSYKTKLFNKVKKYLK